MRHDEDLSAEARRLSLSALLTRHGVAKCQAEVIRPDADARHLLELALDLAAGSEDLGGKLGLRFVPSFPGVTTGVEPALGGARLVLACDVRSAEDGALGVAFTVLIAGRPLRVSISPPVTPIPAHWRRLEELLAGRAKPAEPWASTAI